MATAADAKQWANDSLRGFVEASYLTYDADGGLDEEALRAMVRYILVDLDAAGLHIDSTVCEFWAIPRDLRMRSREIVLDEMHKAKPESLKVVCCYGTSPSETVELANQASELGGDIAMIMTPYLEGCGLPGVRKMYEYIADNTDIALGIFNSEVSGIVLPPDFIADLAKDIPAVCAIKNAIFKPDHSIALNRLAGDAIAISEYDLLAHLAGVSRAGRVAPVQLGNAFYLIQQPGDLRWNEWWHEMTVGDLDKARRMYLEEGMYELYWSIPSLVMACPFRPGVWHHHAHVMKYWAGLLGMPVGAHPDRVTPGSPQPDVDPEWRQRIHDTVERAGLEIRGDVAA